MCNTIGFTVSYETFTPESVEIGCSDDRGIVAERLPLREAVHFLFARDHGEDSGLVEADSYPLDTPRWFTSYGTMGVRDGTTENRSLHLPTGTTRSTARRIARLIGCYGA